MSALRRRSSVACAAIYAAAGASMTDPPGTIALASRLLGPGLRFCADLDPRAGDFVASPVTGELVVRDGLPHGAEALVVGRGLAAMRTADTTRAERDRVAAELQAPTPALRRAVAAWGEDVPRLAEAFATTEDAIRVRLEELRRPRKAPRVEG